MRLRAVRVTSLILLAPGAAWAEAATATTDTTPLPEVTVIGTSPLPGTGIDIDKIPGNTQTLSSTDISREGSASVLTALKDELGSVSINDNLDDPYQPDILYRGFEASPVVGTPQGLAVYQNGVRINEAFGDAVNWDLFPDIAVDRLAVVSSNPVYGLNALGGAVIVSMKNGFTAPGGEIELSGGSFGQRQASVEYGVNSGPWGAYIAGRVLDSDGWREFSPDSLRQFYSDLSAHTDLVTLDLSFTGANNRLFGQSSTPVQELAVDRALDFTTPQGNFNQLEFVTLSGTVRPTDTLSIESEFYYREFRQTVVNGNTTDYTSCADARYAGYLCQGDGVTPLTNSAGKLLPDISDGGRIPIGENDFESIRSVGLGGSLQANSTQSVLSHPNQLSVGATVDSADTDFQSSAEIGTINSQLRVLYGGLYVDTPEGNQFTATPVGLQATNSYYGLFITDTLDLTPDLSITASGRYNVALIDLADQLGTALNGQSRYSRFNPALGFTDKITPNLTFYAGYSEGSRAPTASEIECSNPLKPCLLPSSLASDPPTLKQVVSATYETGFRGTLAPDWLGDNARITWNASLFRTDLTDDIYGIATSLSAGYFQNIGGTRRQGAELGLKYRDSAWSSYLNYSYVDATFESSLTLNSPSNPYQNASGNIFVKPGDHLPGIPQHRLKAGADYRILDGWLVGGSLTYVGAQYYRGDESNQLGPLDGYVVVNLHSSYELTDRIELFATLDNAFNAQYSSFGVLGDPTGVGAPGIPADGVTNGPGIDNRFQSPASPIAAYGGIRYRF